MHFRAGFIRRVVFTLLALTSLLGSALPSAAATRYVDPTRTCPGSGTQASPYCKIQTAICNAAAGDLVSVAPGTYAESIRMRPGVSVVSTGGYTVTTIDGTGRPCTQGASTPPNAAKDFCAALSGSTQCAVVVFGSGFEPPDRIDGFTI